MDTTLQNQHLTPQPAQKQQTLPALTSLRFFAALLIVLHHFGPNTLGGHFDVLDQLFRMGGSGVGFFFVLSGFVMAWVYWNGGQSIVLRKYYVARLSRIYPLYLVGFFAAISILFIVPSARVPWLDPHWYLIAAALGLFLLQAWVPLASNLINGPGWSLSAEAFFYLIFPWFIQSSVCRWMSSRPIRFIALWTFLGAAPSAIVFFYFPSILEEGPQRNSFLLNLLGFFPLFRVFEFFQGICFGLICLQKRHWFQGRLYGDAGLLLCFAVLTLVLVLSTDASVILFHNGLLSPVFGYIIAYVGLSGRRVFDFLAHPFLILLGEASFSMYILHMPLKSLLAFGWRQVIGPDNTSGFLIALLAFIIAVSIVSFKWIELPLRKFVRKGAP